MVAIPEGGDRNSSGDLSRLKVSDCGHHGITGGRGGFPGGVVGASELMHNTCEMSNSNAKRCTAGRKNLGECLTCGNLYD